MTGSIDGFDFELDSAKLIVQVNLEYIPADPQEDENASVTSLNLKIKNKSANPDIPVVSLVTCNLDSTPTGQAVTAMGKEVVEDVIPALVVDWLNQNLAVFAHVFCTVELNKYIDKSEGWKWTRPTDVGYAYVDGKYEQNSLLGILCMTGGRKRSAQQSDILDANAIPNGSVAGFLVAEKQFLEELIMPTIPLHWKNANLDQFEIIPNGDTSTGRYEWVLQLKEGQCFDIQTVKYKDGSGNYAENTPQMKSFSIATDGLSLTMTAYTETNVGVGVVAWNKSIHEYELTLGTNGKGQQTINYRSAGTPVTTHGARKTEGAKILEWMTIAVGVIAMVVLGIMTDGAAFMAGALIIGVLSGIAADSPDIVKTANTDASPSTDLLSFNTTNPIKWANSKVFQLTEVRLNGPLQLGGNPNFD
ncbi:MAG: TULIP family P47-like protein [Caldilineaceae bacterium]